MTSKYQLDCADLFEEYKSQWFYTPKLREDFDVYRISNYHAAKLVKGREHWEDYDEKTQKGLIKDLINECLLHTQAYQLGISVPKPEGLFKVIIRTEEDSCIIAPAFVMEYVPGNNLLVLSLEQSEGLNSAMTQRDESLEKARNAGFIPADIHFENNIWNSARKKLCLIDLGKWGVKR
jgi:hypothetical protein